MTCWQKFVRGGEAAYDRMAVSTYDWMWTVERKSIQAQKQIYNDKKLHIYSQKLTFRLIGLKEEQGIVAVEFN